MTVRIESLCFCVPKQGFETDAAARERGVGQGPIGRVWGAGEERMDMVWTAKTYCRSRRRPPTARVDGKGRRNTPAAIVDSKGRRQRMAANAGGDLRWQGAAANADGERRRTGPEKQFHVLHVMHAGGAALCEVGVRGGRWELQNNTMVAFLLRGSVATKTVKTSSVIANSQRCSGGGAGGDSAHAPAAPRSGPLPALLQGKEHMLSFLSADAAAALWDAIQESAGRVS
eukprot:gene17006-biopygen802